jgi:ATP-dependent Clp protease ATP-binding subunit ClpA
VFERFTKEAKLAVRSAMTEAEMRGDEYVGTEHLLLGVLVADPLLADALSADLTVAREALHRADLEALAAAGVTLAPLDPLAGAARRRHLTFTSGARTALRRTLDEAVRCGERRLTPRHLLLAILAADRRDPARLLLGRLDVDVDAVRRRLGEGRRRAS